MRRLMVMMTVITLLVATLPVTAQTPDPAAQPDGTAICPLLDAQGTVTESYDRVMTLAQTSYNLNEYEDAAGLYDCGVRWNMNDPAPFSGLGLAYTAMGEYEWAIEEFNHALVIDPNFVRAYNNRGYAYYTMGDLDEALNDFNRAIQLDSAYARAFNNRGLLYYDLGNYSGALADFNRAIDLHHEPPHWPYFNRGRTYQAMGDFELAANDFEQAINLQPGYLDSYTLLEAVYRSMGNDDEADAVEERMTRLMQGFSPEQAAQTVEDSDDDGESFFSKDMVARVLPMLVIGAIVVYAIVRGLWPSLRRGKAV